MAEVLAFASVALGSAASAARDLAPGLASQVSGVLGDGPLGALAGSIFGVAREIGVMIPDVVVEESARDAVVITRHPVERGAAITDHSFKEPAEVVIRAGWSASGRILPRAPGYVSRVYRQLIAYQDLREPITIKTGKRTYQNMLIESVTQTTDAASENALYVTVICREVIIVQSRTTTVAPREQQAQPHNTDPVQQTGQAQARPAAAPPTSALIGLGFKPTAP